MATNWQWAAGAVLVSVTAFPAHAGEGDLDPARRTLVVRTYNRFGVSARDLSTAEATAGQLFEDIGIRVVWMDCGSGGHQLASLTAHCDEVVTAAEVILRICAAGPGHERESASKGFALVSSDATGVAVLATVFADRVLDVARVAGVDPRPLLGRAIGHELGHLLLSTDAHAAIGLMRAKWSQVELRRTSPADWRFLDTEAHVIQDAVTRRIASALPKR